VATGRHAVRRIVPLRASVAKIDFGKDSKRNET
jgi:hypothetical protein